MRNYDNNKTKIFQYMAHSTASIFWRTDGGSGAIVNALVQRFPDRLRPVGKARLRQTRLSHSSAYPPHSRHTRRAVSARCERSAHTINILYNNLIKIHLKII